MTATECECETQVLGDGYCDDECNNRLCNYDEYDCCNADCSYECAQEDLGNGSCDEGCNNVCCDYDQGDCDS
jgi:hypothetical protein